MGKKYKKNFAITIFNTITVMCITFTAFFLECNTAYGFDFSLKSIFGKDSAKENKVDKNKTTFLNNTALDS